MPRSPLRAALLATCLFLLGPHSALALTPPAPPQIPEQVSNPAWEEDMARFAQADAAHPPKPGGVLFVGSSSIRFWQSLASDFPGVDTLNRGFGGSEIRDSTWYADRIVVPYKPRLIVFYAGDNDLNSGRSPQQLRADFLAFVARVRRDLPGVRIAYIAIKPSPARAALLPKVAEANGLIRKAAAGLKQVEFIDVYTPMLGKDGQPRAELFGPDHLHMNAAGYALWRDIVRPYLKR
ncbi:SGNH/GDSL hydrolase family protein [Xanthomonas sp. AM6]|uniref:SGNH/GDSL hydrolase family protein n=1 Tax=Xanthomonas sp. AM6 TaxID=2982531 RepID=UPI0021D89625|nr:SGNH/GDSL hydrolase family protein [Xanthomonas sp. AM6]UYB51557.1 SGNH/GDSL hydrolase family protein [Xanthomonas sp. AM6]